MKTNRAVKKPPVFTHEGAPASKINAERALRRSVMACMLWEDGFYESGVTIADRIKNLIPQCSPEFVAACAYEARTKMNLRHVPLLLVREMARLPNHKAVVSRLLCDVIQRVDEITEFLAIYWKDDAEQPISAQVKKGLAMVFNKFDEFQFAKYDRDGAVKLRDVLFLCHANPCDIRGEGYTRYTKAERKEERAAKEPSTNKHVKAFRNLNEREKLFRAIVDRELETPDTWEVQLSAGADKRATFERLMEEGKLGALAFLRNLRNMKAANVSKKAMRDYAEQVNIDRVLPFRFITAARIVSEYEDILEPLMLKCLAGKEKLPGHTALMVDVSVSMNERLSGKSETTRLDAAYGLGILLREVCEEVSIFTFSDALATVPPRRGFALRDAMDKSQRHHGTNLGMSLKQLHGIHNAGDGGAFDRVIVITDEQSADKVKAPFVKPGYVINVASNKNGVGYGEWTHIDGWSEAVIDYVVRHEQFDSER